jgi:hypothetical protein
MVRPHRGAGRSLVTAVTFFSSRLNALDRAGNQVIAMDGLRERHHDLNGDEVRTAMTP